MGNQLPVIYRIARWFEARRALCQYCRHMPAVENRFCSERCEEAALERQAHG
jgi:hypothetical protein